MNRGFETIARVLGPLSLTACMVLEACGGAAVTTGANEPRRNEWGDIVSDDVDPLLDPAPFDPKAFIRAYAAPRLRIFWPIQETEQVLSRAVRSTRERGAKREAQRRLLTFRFQAAEAATDAARRTSILRTITREERTMLRGNTDPALAAEVAFMHLWLAYAAGDYDARRLADAFVDQPSADAEMVRVAQLIRAEMAFHSHEVANARSLFERLEGTAADGLTAYAHYRAARLLCLDGQIEPCRRMLGEVRVLACAANASEASREFGGRAAAELGSPEVPRRDRPDGAPAHCSAADIGTASAASPGPAVPAPTVPAPTAAP